MVMKYAEGGYKSRWLNVKEEDAIKQMVKTVHDGDWGLAIYHSSCVVFRMGCHMQVKLKINP